MLFGPYFIVDTTKFQEAADTFRVGHAHTGDRHGFKLYPL